MHLSTLQHGAYCLLMDAYWVNQGPLPDDDHQLAQIAKLSLSDWSAMRSVIAKFFILGGSESKVWMHKRIELELSKAVKQKEAKSLAAKNTNKKRWFKESLSESLSDTQTVSQNCRSSPSPSVCLEREHVSAAPLPECNGNPTLPEVLSKAQMIGLAEWKARDWFDEMQGCGWLDHSHRPIRDWGHVLTRVCRKWEADGRPATPPQARRFPGQSVPSVPKPQQPRDESVWKYNGTTKGRTTGYTVDDPPKRADLPPEKGYDVSFETCEILYSQWVERRKQAKPA